MSDCTHCGGTGEVAAWKPVYPALPLGPKRAETVTCTECRCARCGRYLVTRRICPTATPDTRDCDPCPDCAQLLSDIAHLLGWSQSQDRVTALSAESLALRRVLRDLRDRGYLGCVVDPPCGDCAPCRALTELTRHGV